MQNKVKRYLVFLLGLFVNSLGVALITKADLGTSPISSIPYVLSLSFPFSLGQFTIFFSILLIVLQLVILGRNFKAEHLLQIPVSLVFGYFIDLCMLLLFFVQPAAYVLKILYLLVGCIVLGIGVYMEVLANVIMLPGESFVRAVVFRWKTEFGVTKVAFDVSMAIIASVLGIVLTGHLNGVREGTVIAALLVGFIARLIGKKLSFLPEMLFGAEPAEDKEAPQSTAEEPICIAVGRQFGSGGHDIAKKLADRLGFAFYDEELIQMAAGTTGYQPEFIAKTEEKCLTACFTIWQTRCTAIPTSTSRPRTTSLRPRSRASARPHRKTASSSAAVPTGYCGIIRAASASFCTRRSITASARSCSAST